MAAQLVTDVVARHAVPGGDADGEDDQGEGEHRVALQDRLVDGQQLLGLGVVTWANIIRLIMRVRFRELSMYHLS